MVSRDAMAKALAHLEAKATILVRLSWSEDHVFFYLSTKHAKHRWEEAQPTKTTAKARTTAKTTADFSTAAANAPPSVEMTILQVLESL